MIILTLTAGLLLAATSQGVTKTTILDVEDTAHKSIYINQLNKQQAAGLLQSAIEKGQQKKVLLRYLGVSPRIKANITPEHIRIRFKKFDEFTEKPVLWSREGSKMKDFTSPWSKVADISATILIDDQIGGPLEYLMLHLSSGNKNTSIPLDLEPGGYNPSDIFLAALILNDSIPASSAMTTNIPNPEPTPPVASSAPSEPAPADRPTADIPAELASDAVEETVIIEMPEETTPILIPTIEQRLETLKGLYNKGLIDKDVYREKQQQILQDL